MRRTNLSRSSLLVATALAGCALAHTDPARADDTGAQISSIEKQIRNLQGELGRMKRSLARRDADVRAARDEAAAANRQAMSVSQRVTNGSGQPLAPQPLSAPPGYMMGSMGSGGVPKYGPYVYVGGVPTPVQYPGPKLTKGQFELLGVRVSLGGFISADSVVRSRNETLDIASNFNNGIPYRSSPNYHTPEFHESARLSRVSLLVEGNADNVTKLTAYWEADFQGAGSSSNSAESNSYVLRERMLYAQITRSDWDFYVLGGQAYSLLTQNRIGIVPRQENTPLTIDPQFVPGFVWTRNTGVRFVKGFDHDRFDLGLSFESPQAAYYTGGNGTGSLVGTIDSTNAGSGTLNPDTTYSDDIAPDVIVKGTADPGWGHYEVYGIARFLHDRTSVVGNGNNHTVLAGGGGADAIVPLIPGKLELTGSVLAGEGIGRYGTAQLPDATFFSHRRAAAAAGSHRAGRTGGAPGIAVRSLRLCRHRADHPPRKLHRGQEGLRLRQPAVQQRRLQHRAADHEPAGDALHGQHIRRGAGHRRRLVALPARGLRHRADRDPVFLHPQDSVRRCRRQSEHGRQHDLPELPLPALPLTPSGQERKAQPA